MYYKVCRIKESKKASKWQTHPSFGSIFYCHFYYLTYLLESSRNSNSANVALLQVTSDECSFQGSFDCHCRDVIPWVRRESTLDDWHHCWTLINFGHFGLFNRGLDQSSHPPASAATLEFHFWKDDVNQLYCSRKQLFFFDLNQSSETPECCQES